VAGYLLVATKLISYVAYRTAILWAPQVELVLTIALTCASVIAVARSPTHLRWPYLCALAVLLVPTDAEVFAVSPYALWWAGLLLPLALLWDSGRGYELVRWLYILFGGLSSPIIVPIAVLFWLRAGMERQQTDMFAAVLASVIAGIQIVVIHYQPIEINTASINFLAVLIGLRQFIGAYFYFAMPVLASAVIAALLALAAWSARTKLDRWFLLLVLMFCAMCASVALRLPITVLQAMDPLDAGARYFFYPFILLAWIMISIASQSALPVRVGIGAAMACALVLALHGMSRRHDAINWRDHILACAQSPGSYAIPVHRDGRVSAMWSTELTGADCRALMRQSLF
jgi:hypothetical protein